MAHRILAPIMPTSKAHLAETERISTSYSRACSCLLSNPEKVTIGKTIHTTVNNIFQMIQRTCLSWNCYEELKEENRLRWRVPGRDRKKWQAELKRGAGELREGCKQNQTSNPSIGIDEEKTGSVMGSLLFLTMWKEWSEIAMTRDKGNDVERIENKGQSQNHGWFWEN